MTAHADRSPFISRSRRERHSCLTRLRSLPSDSGTSGEDQAPSKPLCRLSERVEGLQHLTEPAPRRGGGRMLRKQRIYARRWMVVKRVELEAVSVVRYTPPSTCVATETENACEKIVFDICRCTRIRLLWFLHIMLTTMLSSEKY